MDQRHINLNRKMYSFNVDVKEESDFGKAKKIFNKFGFVVLKNFIKKNIIIELRNELLEKIQSNSIINPKKNIHFIDSDKLSSAHNLSSFLANYQLLRNDSNILRLTKELYGDTSSDDFNSSYFAKPKQVGLETKAHQDNAYFCRMPADVATFWFPVSYSNMSNGALYYFAKSHNIGELEHAPQGNLGASMCLTNNSLNRVIKLFQKIYVEVELGDCIMHNALVVHGSEANIGPNDRNAFNFSVASSHAKVNKKKYENYQNLLANFLASKKGQTN